MKKYLFELYTEICSWRICPWRIRTILYRLVGMKIAFNAAIYGGGYFSGGHLVLGSGSYINRNCIIDCEHAEVCIGEKVGIACSVSIYTTSHDYSDKQKRTGNVIGKSVIIEDGVWISGNVVICPGVKIEKGCVIAAGSVVSKNCYADGLYAGNPAKRIKNL